MITNIEKHIINNIIITNSEMVVSIHNSVLMSGCSVEVATKDLVKTIIELHSLIGVEIREMDNVIQVVDNGRVVQEKKLNE